LGWETKNSNTIAKVCEFVMHSTAGSKASWTMRKAGKKECTNAVYEVLARYTCYIIDLQVVKALHTPLQFVGYPLHY